MTALTGTPVQNNYFDVLQIGNSGLGVDATLRPVAGGNATATPLELSTASVNIASGGQLGGVAFGALATLSTVDTAQIDNLSVTEGKLSTAVQAKLNASQNNKFDAIVAPDGDNDSAGTDATAIGTDGTAVYEVGSTWIDTVADQAYRCVDATPTAAVWIETTLSTGDLGTMALQNANSVAITGGTVTGVQIQDALTIFIETAADQEYKVFINIPFSSGTINNTTSRSRSGTCTATFSINGVSLGGSANSVSSVEQIQAHASANTFVSGDDIEVTISANASCEGATFTIDLDRAIA